MQQTTSTIVIIFTISINNIKKRNNILSFIDDQIRTTGSVPVYEVYFDPWVQARQIVQLHETFFIYFGNFYEPSWLILHVYGQYCKAMHSFHWISLKVFNHLVKLSESDIIFASPFSLIKILVLCTQGGETPLQDESNVVELIYKNL